MLLFIYSSISITTALPVSYFLFSSEFYRLFIPVSFIIKLESGFEAQRG